VNATLLAYAVGALHGTTLLVAIAFVSLYALSVGFEKAKNVSEKEEAQRKQENLELYARLFDEELGGVATFLEDPDAYYWRVSEAHSKWLKEKRGL